LMNLPKRREFCAKNGIAFDMDSLPINQHPYPGQPQPGFNPVNPGFNPAQQPAFNPGMMAQPPPYAPPGQQLPYGAQQQQQPQQFIIDTGYPHHHGIGHHDIHNDHHDIHDAHTDMHNDMHSIN
jgi:hypothetical protein